MKIIRSNIPILIKLRILVRAWAHQWDKGGLKPTDANIFFIKTAASSSGSGMG